MACFEPFTIEEVQGFLATAKEEYSKALTAKSYTIDGRSKTTQSLAQLKNEIMHWSAELARLQGNNCGINRTLRVIPRDL